MGIKQFFWGIAIIGGMMIGSVVNAVPVIEGQALEATFDSTYFNIQTIVHKDTGAILAGWQSDPSETLFRIKMRASSGSIITIYNYTSCNQRNYSSSQIGNKNILTLTYSGFDLAAESQVVDVIVTVTAYTDKPEIEWEIDVDNRSTSYGVWEVDFPYVCFAPIDGTAANDCIVYSVGAGKLFRNPYDATSRYEQRMWDTLEYPFPLNSQWAALYDEELGGLYLATHDSTAYHKKFNFPLHGGKVWFYVTGLPEDKGQAGIDYNSPYPINISYTPGHWYDAAQIYRQWALQQVWASAGPLATRSDIPLWYKDAPYCLVAYSYDGDDTVEKAKCNTLAHKKFLGYDGKIPLIWYLWPQYRPDQTGVGWETAGTHAGHPFPAKDGFDDAVAFLEAEGIYTQPYVNARVFDVPDINDPCYPWPGWQSAAAKDIDGSYISWSSKVPSLLDICRGTEFYRNVVRDNCVRLAQDFGAKGAYLDQFPDVTNECFDISHGHPLGGGNWQFYAMRQMAGDIRNACRAVDADSVFSGENGAEFCMDLMDGMLFHNDLWPHFVPLSMAVYGDYWLPYGRYLRETELADDTLFRFGISNRFVYGIMLGRVDTTSTAKLTNTNYAKNMKLLKELIKYRMSAKKYLIYGRMLRPINFDNAVPELNYVWDPVPPLGPFPVIQPAIMSSVWDGSDGTTGVVLFNISDQPQDYQFTLSDEDYPVLNSSTEIYKFMRSDGTKLFVEQVDSGSCMMSGQLQPDEVRIFVLAPVGLASTCEEKWQLGLGSAVDLNRDCQVNFKDFIEIVNEWQQCNNPVDFNCI